MSANRSDARGSGRLRAWRDAHLAGLLSALGRLLARPFGSLLTLSVLALAIALPLCLAAFVKEAGRFAGAFNDSRDISVFLRPELDAAAARAFAERHRGDARVAALELRSPEQGLEELREMRDLDEALQALEHNPLPWMLVIAPAASADDHALAEELRALPEVDLLQHDARWRERLAAWLALGRQLAWLAALLLGAGVVLVVANTVRLEVQARAEEIATLRLLGATDAFVRRPYLYLGAWYGLFSGLGALAVAGAAAWSLSPLLEALISSYGSRFSLLGASVGELALVVGAAMVLGVLGAFLAVGHHLRQAESQA